MSRLSLAPRVAVAAIALAVAAACTPAGPKPEQTADAIYAGGDIVTVNDAQPAVEALAVKDGKILATGARVDIEEAHKQHRRRDPALRRGAQDPEGRDDHGLRLRRHRHVGRPAPEPRRLAEFPVAGWGKYDRRFKIGGVKVTIDGSPQGRTAAFTKPYLTGGPGGEKNWSGSLFVQQGVINQGLKKVYGLGVPVTFHANGDAAIDALFEAHEFAAADDPTRDRNVTVIHAQFTRKDQIPRYVQYRMRPSFYTLHTYYFAEAHIRNRGQAQAMYISPMRDAIDAGLHPTNHTDAVVAPLPLKVEPMAIKDIQVLETFKEGMSIYRKQ